MNQLLKQKVRVKITEVNRSRKRVVGSIRAVAQKERRERAEKIWSEIEVGKQYHGTVKSLTSYGAFVDIGIKQDGLVHISQLADRYVASPADVVHLGQHIEVRVTGIDTVRNRIALSMRKNG